MAEFLFSSDNCICKEFGSWVYTTSSPHFLIFWIGWYHLWAIFNSVLWMDWIEGLTFWSLSNSRSMSRLSIYMPKAGRLTQYCTYLIPVNVSSAKQFCCCISQSNDECAMLFRLPLMRNRYFLLYVKYFIWLVFNWIACCFFWSSFCLLSAK